MSSRSRTSTFKSTVSRALGGGKKQQNDASSVMSDRSTLVNFQLDDDAATLYESADRSSHSTPFHYALDNSKKVSRGNDRAWDPRNSNSRSLSGTPPCPMRPSSSKKVKGTKTQGMEAQMLDPEDCAWV